MRNVVNTIETEQSHFIVMCLFSLKCQNIKFSKDRQILIYLNLKTKVGPVRQIFLHDMCATQFRLHEKTGVELSYTRQIAWEGKLTLGNSSGIFLIDNQPNKPFSLFRKLFIFLDRIHFFRVQVLVINIVCLAMAKDNRSKYNWHRPLIH